MRQVEFDKLDPGEAITLIHTLGHMSESQFKQVLPNLEFLLTRFLLYGTTTQTAPDWL
jgi:hypothetical protein